MLKATDIKRSYMRLVRLKPHGAGSERVPDRPVQVQQHGHTEVASSTPQRRNVRHEHAHICHICGLLINNVYNGDIQELPRSSLHWPIWRAVRTCAAGYTAYPTICTGRRHHQWQARRWWPSECRLETMCRTFTGFQPAYMVHCPMQTRETGWNPVGISYSLRIQVCHCVSWLTLENLAVNKPDHTLQ